MKYMLMFIIIFIFSGCLYINERGISTKYYNECHEYYDATGIYHKNCDKNLINFENEK